MKKLTNNMIVGIILSILLLTLGILLLPQVTDLGTRVLSIVAAVLLILYLIFFLFDRLTHSGGTVRILTAIEFTLLALIALGLIFAQFRIFKSFSVCQILAIAIWLRGCTWAMRGYLVSSPEARRRFPMLLFVAAIAMITFGAYLYAKPFITDPQLVYALAALCSVAAVALFVYALAYGERPKKKAAKKPSAKKSKS